MDNRITVEEGQNLWKLAGEHLGDPKRWIDFFAKNHKIFARLVYIKPGTILELPAPDEHWELVRRKE